MHWTDKIAKEIISSGEHKPYWVDDMKTPSGRIHVGALRGVLIHDLVYKALVDVGKKAKFTWVYEDHDPMDALPVYLEADKWSKYLAQPLFTIPSPAKGSKNFAEYYANEFTEVFNKTGCHPEIIWASQLYKTGKMNDSVKLCLDKADVIKGVYEELYHKKLPEIWYPFQVVCPKCGKESTTKVTDWDGKEVTFTCQINAVDWTKGCGYEGKISPFSGDGKFVGKLPWKVEWPVKWMVIGVTVEGAGKDHMSAGGSHDVAKLICERVLNYPVPFPIGYEWFLLGGRKMSTSKGVGSSAKEISEVLPPYLLRFLFARTDYNEAINFDPAGTMVIPDLFDEYDKAWQAYIDGSDEGLARTFELSQVGKILPKKKIILPRFRDIVNYLQQPNVDIKKMFSGVDEKFLNERVSYAKIWIENYAPQEFRLEFKERLSDKDIKRLSEEQKKYLGSIVELVGKETDPEKLQTKLYERAKELGIDTKSAFAGIYQILIGRDHGPKAAWLLLSYPKEKVVKRLKETSA